MPIRTKRNLKFLHALEQKPCFSHLAFLIAYPPVEFFPFQAEEIVSRLQDAAFGCYGAGCVDVVPGDHAYRDPGTLALFNSIRDLIERTGSDGTPHLFAINKR